jgi:hypothetical protein
MDSSRPAIMSSIDGLSLDLQSQYPPASQSVHVMWLQRRHWSLDVLPHVRQALSPPLSGLIA